MCSSEIQNVGSSHCPFPYIAGKPTESPQASTDISVQSMQLPDIEQLVTLDYSALTTGVHPQSVIKPARRMRSYDRRHVDEREARAKMRHMRLNKKYQQLQVSYQELKKECKQQQTQIKCLKAQLAKTCASLTQKGL